MFERRWLVEEWFEGEGFYPDVTAERFRWDDDAMEYVLKLARETILITTFDFSREAEDWVFAWRCRISNIKTGKSKTYDATTVPLPTQVEFRYLMPGVELW